MLHLENFSRKPRGFSKEQTHATHFEKSEHCRRSLKQRIPSWGTTASFVRLIEQWGSVLFAKKMKGLALNFMFTLNFFLLCEFCFPARSSKFSSLNYLHQYAFYFLKRKF